MIQNIKNYVRSSFGHIYIQYAYHFDNLAKRYSVNIDHQEQSDNHRTF